MVVALLANLKIQIWLISCLNIKSPDMFVVLLAKKSKYGCYPTGIFNIPDMVDVLLVHKASIHGY